MQWFRMYADAVDDEKLRLIAFEDRWHFVALLCLKANGTLDSGAPHLERRIAVKLGVQLPQLEEIKRRLTEVGLVDEAWQPLAWKKRQFTSDSSTERTRKWRERHGDVSGTSQERSSDALEQNRTEQIQNRTEQRKRARTKRATRVPEDFSPDLDLARRELPDIDAEREAQKFRDWEFKTPRSDWAAVWRNWIERCRDRGEYARKPKDGVMMFAGKPVEWQ